MKRAPTLSDVLASRGYGHAAIPHNNAGRRLIFRNTDGEVMGAFDVVEAWEWVKANSQPVVKAA